MIAFSILWMTISASPVSSPKNDKDKDKPKNKNEEEVSGFF